MLFTSREKKDGYDGKYMPKIANWRFIHLIFEDHSVETAEGLMDDARRLPSSDENIINVPDNYPCKVEGVIFGHSVFPDRELIVTSEIRSIQKVEDSTDLVSVTTKSGSVYYLGI